MAKKRVVEYGVIIPQGIRNIPKRVPEIIEDRENDRLGSFRLLIQRLVDRLKELDRQVEELEVEIQLWHRKTTACQKLAEIRGILLNNAYLYETLRERAAI